MSQSVAIKLKTSTAQPSDAEVEELFGRVLVALCLPAAAVANLTANESVANKWRMVQMNAALLESGRSTQMSDGDAALLEAIRVSPTLADVRELRKRLATGVEAGSAFYERDGLALLASTLAVALAGPAHRFGEKDGCLALAALGCVRAAFHAPHSFCGGAVAAVALELLAVGSHFGKAAAVRAALPSLEALAAVGGAAPVEREAFFAIADADRAEALSRDGVDLSDAAAVLGRVAAGAAKAGKARAVGELAIAALKALDDATAARWEDAVAATFVDPRVAQNVGIALKKLRLKPSELARAVADGDDVLTNKADLIPVPSGDDLDAAKDYDPSITALRDVEAFLPRGACPTLPNASRRSSSRRRGRSSATCSTPAAPSRRRRRRRASDAVRLALAAALAVGNYLNGGSAGEAAADLDGVAKLATTKGADGTTLAMHVVAGVDRRDSGAVARLAALEPALTRRGRSGVDATSAPGSRRSGRSTACSSATRPRAARPSASASAASRRRSRPTRNRPRRADEAARRRAPSATTKQPFDLFRKLLTLVRTLKTAHEANRRRAKPKADAKGGDPSTRSPRRRTREFAHRRVQAPLRGAERVAGRRQRGATVAVQLTAFHRRRKGAKRLVAATTSTSHFAPMGNGDLDDSASVFVTPAASHDALIEPCPTT
ncbi:hypothetical protein JL720_11979 [Aureococcus anophagefferens]|nr:hypothetical protein JL720_11979 [Aureococcus anophagefferens]